MKLKLTALALALVLLLGLAACGGTPATTADPSAEPTTEPTADPEATPEVAARDYSAAYAAMDPDTVVMTVNGLDVTWETYFYWLHAAVTTIENYTGTPVEDFDALFDADNQGRTYAQYAMSYAQSMCEQYCALASNAADMNVSLSEEDQAALDAQWESDVTTYGGGDESAFLAYIEEMYMTREIYDYMNEVNTLYYNCFVEQYGAMGEKCSDAEAQAFAETNNYLHVKHILLSTTDETGAAVSDEEKAAIREEAVALIAELRAASDLESAFDAAMAERSEDPGLASYPDGYTFTTGTMMEAFEGASRTLEEGQITAEPVETTAGYHIILRLPMDINGVVQYNSAEEQYTLRYSAALAAYNQMVSGWFENVDTVLSPELEELDLQTLLNA